MISRPRRKANGPGLQSGPFKEEILFAAHSLSAVPERDGITREREWLDLFRKAGVLVTQGSPSGTPRAPDTHTGVRRAPLGGDLSAERHALSKHVGAGCAAKPIVLARVSGGRQL